MRGLLGISIITCAVLYGLLAAILVAVCLYSDLPVWVAFVTCIVVILLQFLISPWITDLIQRWFYKTDFEVEMPDYVEDFVNQVCKEQNMNHPRMGFINDGAPNAFTYGRTKNDARIVLTRGIFELLTEDEVKAVVAHELGHAVHYDMMLMTMVQLVPMVLYAVYDICLRGKRGGSSSSGKGDYSAIVGLVAYIFYIICQYIILWLSRVREYYADEFSAEATHNPAALASALVNIGFGLSTRDKAAEAKGSVSGSSTIGIFDARHSRSLVVSCYDNGKIDKSHIKNAMKWELWNVWAFWFEIGSTHPLISKRLIALSNLAEQMGTEPFIVFDYEKPESYMDDFLRELFISWMPALALIACCIVAFVMVFPTDSDAMMQTAAMIAAGGLVLCMALSMVKYRYTHPTAYYHDANVNGLLGEVKVSMVKSIPAQLKGKIIGRGNPGCIFNEDFVLQDETGIIFLDYNQPLWIINKVFALFKSPEYFDKQVIIRGWYRRSIVPFFELYSMEVDGEIKKCYSYGFGWIWRIVLFVLALGLLAFLAFGGVL